MSRPERILNHIPQSDLVKFQELFHKVQEKEGSKAKAMKVLGISIPTMYKLLGGQMLTDKQARVMLSNYKAWRASCAESA